MVAAYIMFGLGIAIFLGGVWGKEERGEFFVAGVAALVFGAFLAWIKL